MSSNGLEGGGGLSMLQPGPQSAAMTPRKSATSLSPVTAARGGCGGGRGFTTRTCTLTNSINHCINSQVLCRNVATVHFLSCSLIAVLMVRLFFLPVLTCRNSLSVQSGRVCRLLPLYGGHFHFIRRGPGSFTTLTAPPPPLPSS